MVDLDVVAHPQQLVQARGRLTRIHVSWKKGSICDNNGFEGEAILFIRQQDQTGQSEIPLWIPVNEYGTNLTKQTKRISIT